MLQRNKLLFSVFNTALRSYSTQLIVCNNKKQFSNNIAGRPSSSFEPNRKNLPTGCTSGSKYSSDSSPTVTFEEVQSLLLTDDANVLVIDVREPQELQESGVIPGSINIPLGQVDDVLRNMNAEQFKVVYGRAKPDADFQIVFSCKKGIRSADAQDLARKLGYSNVRNYLGGWTDWEEKTNNK